MGAVDKVIYNQIVRHKSVKIEDLGTIIVEPVVAKLVNGKSITAPKWVVSVSKRDVDGVEDLLMVISRELSIDLEDAKLLYDRWLVVAKHDDGSIIIEDVGVISKGFLKLDLSLSDLLNPFHGALVKVSKPRNNRWFVVASSVFMLCLIVFVLTRLVGIDVEPESQVVRPKVIVEQVKSVERDRVVVVDSGAIKSPKVEDTVKVEPQVDRLVDRYYVVGGVFSTEDNAKAFVSERSGAGGLNLEIIPFKGGKFVVSFYSSEDKEVASERMAELDKTYPGVWIYRNSAKKSDK